MARRVGKLVSGIVGLGQIGAAILILNGCGARHDETATAGNPANINQAASPGNTPTVTPAPSPAPTNAGPNPPAEKTIVEKPTLVPSDSQRPQNSSAQSSTMPTQTSPTPSYGVGSGSGLGVGPGRGGNIGYNPNPVRTSPGNTDYNRVFTGREVNQSVRVLQKPEPAYTAAARQNQVTGTVVLSAILTAGGQVTDIKIVRGLPDGLNESAIAAARRIKFTPATLDGHPVSMYLQLEYNFNLY